VPDLKGMKVNASHSIAKAVFETLEGRTYMSGSIGLQDGVLTVKADPNTASRVQVEFAADHTYVQAYATETMQTFRFDQIKSLHLVGSNQNDMIYVDPRLGLPAQIEGLAGNDVIKGGTGLDTIDGGDGNDLIYGHGAISTGSGDDTVWSSDQGDTIYGGSGNDLLIGGSGTNVIYGGSGRSTLIAGQGSNTLIAGTGDQVLYGANGNDTLVGGTGHDTLHGGAGHNLLIVNSTHTIVHAMASDVVQRPKHAPPAREATPVVQAAPPKVHARSTTSATPAPVASPAPSGNVQSPQGTPVTTTAPAPKGSAPQAIINQMENTVIVGEGVNVNGLNSVLHNGTQLTAKYQWNFGDPTGRFNDLTGWNAGHVYDNPGIYKITLKVTDSTGQISTATSQVTLQADTRRVIYVDTHGSDNNTGASPDQAVQSVTHAFLIAGSNMKIEFRRGETFNVDQTVYINGNDQYVGAYGNGVAPVINRGKGDGTVTFFLSSQSHNTTIQDLTFDTPNAVTSGAAPKIGSQTIWAWGTNIVIRGNTFLNTDDAINASMRPTGVIVMDNSAPLITGLRGYFCWVDGTDWTILGNNVANSTREHDIRSSSMATDRVLIAYNVLSNPTRSDDPGEVTKCTINIREGRDLYITGNTLNDGTVGFGPGPWTPASDEVANVVVQGNLIHNGQLYLAGAVHHALVQNNVLDDTGQSQIHILPNEPDYPTRHMLDVTIDHNTGINNTSSGQFLEVSAEDLPGVLTVTNNLYIAPHLNFNAIANVAVLVTAPDLNDFKLISGNIWPTSNAPSGAVNFVNASWYAAGGQTPAQWDAHGNVQGDQFQNVAMPPSVYQTSLNGVIAGSAGLDLAA
jgi:hypothetical protein